MRLQLRFHTYWGILLLLFVMCFAGCSKSSKYKAFIRSHDAIHPGMSIRQAFESGLSDYLIQMKNKNIPGGTLSEKQPVSNACNRHLLDISYFSSSGSGNFWVRIYCGINEPSAPQVIPERSFKNKEEFLKALDSDYATWAKSMSFKVESPPKQLFGVYDNYEIITDAEGKVASVSPINVSK
ncbi:MAG TPA: hypothetical protein VGJ93_10865 [Desulfuromonadaceae bacterium]